MEQVTLALIKDLKMLNDTLVVPSMLYWTMTGLWVSLIIMSMVVFKYTPSSVFKHSKLIFYTANIALLLATFINRLLSYPPKVQFSSFLYVIAFMLYSLYFVYVGTRQKRKKEAYGNKTVAAAANAQSFD